MRGLIDRLSGLLSGSDSRWTQFGLNKPDAPATPAVPQNVHVVATTGHNLMATCDAEPLATSFRWRVKIVGAETEYELNATTSGPLALLTGFTAGQNVDVTCEAVNGDSASVASAPVQATTT